MALTQEQLARAAAAEDDDLRVTRLRGLNPRELRELLAGDQFEAAPWVRSAARLGIPGAQLRLGRMLLAGTGVSRNEREALDWFERAAHQGDAEAMNMVGRCHENGWGTPVNLRSAVASYYESAARGHDWGEYNLGNMLFDGRGMARDPEQALYWYLSAANQGHARAMNLAARCFEEGWGCAKSTAAAIRWYRCSAEAGYFRGQFNYAAVLAHQGKSAEAAIWFCKAAEGGDDAVRRVIADALTDAVDPALRAVRSRVVDLLTP